jgi:hypothetical protein
MTVVEDHRVSQVMVGRPVEGLLALQPGEQHSVRVQPLSKAASTGFAGAGGQVGLGQGGERAVGLAAGAVGRR